MSPRLEFAVEAAVRAGKSTLEHFRADVQVDLKGDDSPVTIADRIAERILRQAIESAYPGEAILGEEEGESGTGSARWVLDPIDGTKSFICGVPLFGTLVAFEESGEPLIGVAYFPALDEIVYAERGKGSFWNGKPCRVSSKASLENSVISCGSHLSLHRHGKLGGLLRLAEQALATRSWSDAYGHILVATGRVEAMVDPVLAYWDIRAPMLIVREAGGMFTDFSGGDNPVNEGLSSNGLLHDSLLEAFRQ